MLEELIKSLELGFWGYQDHLEYNDPPLHAIYIYKGKVATVTKVERLGFNSNIKIITFKYIENGKEVYETRKAAYSNNGVGRLSLESDYVYQISGESISSIIACMSVMGTEIEKITVADKFHYYKASSSHSEGVHLLWSNYISAGKIMNKFFVKDVDLQSIIDLDKRDTWKRAFKLIREDV